MTATLTVLEPGLCTQLVDAGRPHSRSLGVAVGGAADRFALALGNALVGNAPDAAALEVCLLGPRLVVNAPIACVLFGAPFALRTDARTLTAGTTFTLQPGEELAIGPTQVSSRAYLCVGGGLQAPVILGSRSALACVRVGDVFSCTSSTISARFIPAWKEENRPLRVLPGGQYDWFPGDSLTSRSFQVTPASNRMGVRLRGDPLPVPPREMVSEPVCPGTIQVTRDGQCIVLGVDGQTIGGYPKIAHVIDADLDRIGQLRPGQRVRFETVPLDDALELSRHRNAKLCLWLRRLRTLE